MSSAVNITDFGAIGDGIADDTAAIQRAIDAADEIHFPDSSAFYRVAGFLNVGGTDQRGGKRLIGHRPCRGGGPVDGKPALIQGDGKACLLKAIGDTRQNRAIEFIGLSASNRKQPVLVLTSGVDASIDNCWFVSTECTDATMSIRESYFVTVANSTIGCSGGGFAITAYQRCNNLRIVNNRIGGGDLGGGVHVEQSAGVKIEDNQFEIGIYGVVIGSGVRLDKPLEGMVNGAGACHTARVIGNYFEQVKYPLVLGSGMGYNAGSALFAPSVESNYVGNGGNYPLMIVGRVSAGTFRANTFWSAPGSTSCAIRFFNAPGGSVPYANGCLFGQNAWVKGSGPFFGFPNGSVETMVRSANSLSVGVVS